MMKNTTFLKELAQPFLMLSLGLFLFTACQDEVDPLPDPDPDPSAEVIEIEDSELLEILMEELNISNPSELTKGRILQLTELNISNTIVASLNGLEEAENLEILLARSIEVDDLSPISSLEKLKQLDMRDALMPTTLSFLAPLQMIENIDFQNTAVANISALQGKNTLTHINLRETDVADIAPLEGMTQLLFLNLNRAGGGNGISNPEITIPMDKLYYLSLRNTEVGDELMAEIFANKTQMVESNIRNTGITDISFLVPIFEAGAFTQELSDLYGNKISLDLQNNSITNLCVIKQWVDNFPEGELEWSAVAGDFNNCDAAGPVAGEHEFIEDEELLVFILNTLGMTEPSELTEETIKDLTNLSISGSEVASLSGLEKAINLEVFNAQGCGNVEDISALNGMDKLVFLNLRQTAVTDISPLEGMTQLQYLNLNRAGSGNGITNPEIIAPFVNLYYISLRNTALTDEQFEMFENFDQLVECNIRNTGITSIAPLAKAFEKGAFTEELSIKYDNKLSLDLQNNDIEDLCLISSYVGVFPDGEIEWSGTFSFDDCD
ncbi:hypothetical protein [Cecembia sp.]|uniref:hypothetical protein n=1 Tax=Cecembia sp. TaxID=1898110 RepID=UPI0025C571C2|nr:hypothetical protein [Cecembia sp.]